jgi:tRNA(adenine34) deaminase
MAINTALQNKSEAEIDTYYMNLALNLARRAAQRNEVPVGALIVGPDGILGRGHNLRQTLQTPIAHAEMLALHRASRNLGSWRLPNNVTIYSTLEPCVMCAGALIQARASRLVYGAKDPKGGAIHSLFRIAEDTRLNHQISVTTGVLEAECGQILRDFFSMRRKQNKV